MNKSKVLNDNRIVLIMACVVILVLILIIAKNIDTMNKLSEEIDNQKEIYQINKAELDELQGLLLLKPELELTYSILENQIPKRPQEYDIIDHAHCLAVENEANLYDIRLDMGHISEDESSNINEIPVSLILKGSYTSLAEFINDLSEGHRLFRIDKIQLQTESGPDGIINASVTANAFFK